MELGIIAVAFVLGFIAHLLRLPALVGFLVAGFILHAMGFKSTDTISTLSDLGVTLLLFSIGLKLDIKQLLRKEVWGGASLHLSVCFVLFFGALIAIQWLGLSFIQGVSSSAIAITAFALCFSSTVFAVKALEERSEMGTLYGQVAIGVLVIQDLFAVAFITISAGKVPDVWAFGLFVIPMIRPLIFQVLDKVGRGELQVLFALFLALVLGAGLFELVGLKGDLGALLIGMLIASHPRAIDISKSIFSIKELLLIGFFLNVGLQGLPEAEALWLVLILVPLLMLKTVGYFFTFSFFNLRNRTSFIGALSLGNYSEFGLIVMALSINAGWLDGTWLTVMALSLSLSFIIAAPIHKNADLIYQLVRKPLERFEAKNLHIDDQPIELDETEVLVLGMGRIGSGAYDELLKTFERVTGIETELDKVKENIESGRHVLQGDATDSDFWQRLAPSPTLKLVLLAMPDHRGNKYALKQLRKRRCGARIAAIARYKEDEAKLYAYGADAVFNLYDEAGLGFAQQVASSLLEPKSS